MLYFTPKKGHLDHNEPYLVRSRFSLDDKFFGEGDNRNALPKGPKLIDTVFDQLSAYVLNKRTQEFICDSQTFSQIIDFHLPNEVQLSKLPNNVNVSSPLVRFNSVYSLTDGTLHVERNFVSDVPRQVCSHETAQSIASVIAAARTDYGYHPQFVIEPVRPSH
jgi:hypothetical protein